MTAPNPLSVIVVDDEPLARSGVADLVRRDPELRVVAECADGESALEAIQRLRPDLVLLDVQMPGLDGFAVLEQLSRDHLPAIIFITAYDRFAVRAFEVHALDYLVKPFDDARFQDAIDRAKRSIRDEAGQLSGRVAELLDQLERGRMAGAGPESGSAYLNRMVVKIAGHVRFVRVAELDWIEAADYCAKLHAGGKVHVIRESLQALEERLDPAQFFRVHRSAIVNLDRIRELVPDDRGEHLVLLQDGTRLKLSRSRKGALEERLGQPL